jgi:hypothetical protein
VRISAPLYEVDYRILNLEHAAGRAQAPGTPPFAFRVYVDPSTAVAKDTFTKLSAFYAPNKPVAGNWDIAYLDAHHAIHVQKGKVRYYLNLNPIGTDAAKAEKQLITLATWVAGQL